MVMSTEPQSTDDNIEVIEPVIPEVETQEQAPVETTDAPAVEGTEETPLEQAVEPVSVEAPVNETVKQEAPVPQIDQKSIDELYQRRAADEQRDWREATGRKARQLEQQLNDQGYLPEHSRQEARRFVQQEQRIKKQEQDSAEMLAYVQGKQAAAIQFMKQHGLADKQMLDDFIALQTANSPEEMEREAKRMKETRALRAENARLKQGRVAPQTFDNSQGSAEVTTNQDRLLEAYIRGDRSDAAVKAAQRLATGS